MKKRNKNNIYLHSNIYYSYLQQITTFKETTIPTKDPIPQKTQQSPQQDENMQQFQKQSTTQIDKQKR